MAGKEAICPNHDGCTATLKPSDSIGLESRPAFRSALALKAENMPIKDVTNDGDTENYKRIPQCVRETGLKQSLKDLRHFSHSQKRYVLKTTFSTTTTKRCLEKGKGYGLLRI